MYDIIIILLFWGMVLAPCMVAMNVGIEHYREEDEEDYFADGSEFETTPLHPR
jgi:hypothetical protein